MPNLNKYGVSIDAGSVGDRQSPSAPTPPIAIAPIQIKRWIRNGKAPSAELANMLNGAANFAALYRSKEAFSVMGTPSGNPASTAIASKWRFAFHTSAHAHAIAGIAGLLNPINSATRAKATLKIFSDVTESTLVGSADFNYGPSIDSGGFGWRQARWPILWVDGLSPDTDYYGRWDISSGPRLLCASVFEMVSLTETFQGYLTQSITSHSPVLAVDRGNVHTLLRNIWKRGGSKLFNYVVQPGSHLVGTDPTETNSISNTTISTTLTNVLDRSSTTVSSSTPGYYLDLRNKDRVSQASGVPCVMKCFGRATSPGSLEVVLKDSSGTTLATATTSSTTNTWFSSGQFNMPSVLGKVDLQFKTTVGTGRGYLYGVSVYEYED